jgi:hypothetical protein
MRPNAVPDELNRPLGSGEGGVRSCRTPKALSLPVSTRSRAHTGVAVVVDSGTACFDVSTDANIGQIFIDDLCGQTALEDFLITVDGEPVTKLHTEDSPCPDIPSDVFFSLPGNQSTAHVCVTVSGASGGCLTVGAKAADECLIGSVFLLADCTCSGVSRPVARSRPWERGAPRSNRPAAPDTTSQ